MESGSGVKFGTNAKGFIFPVKLHGACILMLLAVNLHAQTEKGRYLVGGNADVSEIIQYTSKTFNLSFSPTFGVFVIDNFLIGGNYTFAVTSATTYNSTSQTHTSTTTIQPGVGPLLKYYLGKKALKGVAMANAGYSVYTRLKSSTGSSSASITNYDGFSVGGSVGLAYFFNNYVSMESGLYINTTGYVTQLPSTRFGISLGLYTFLDKKKPE